MKCVSNLFSTEVNCPSHCLTDCISDYEPINFGALNIKHPCLLSYSRQSLRQHSWDLNTCYRDYSHFQDSLWVKKEQAVATPSFYQFIFKIPSFCLCWRSSLSCWRCISFTNWKMGRLIYIFLSISKITFFKQSQSSKHICFSHFCKKPGFSTKKHIVC